ncbi:MAG: GDSL-type esterase/lipase family protein [Gaiellaceae bacterium]
MKHIPLDGGLVAVEGAVEIVRDGQGLTPLRLPAAVFPLLPPVLPYAAACTSGVRLVLVTDSTSVTIDVEQVNLAPNPAIPPFPNLYDLVVDGELVQTVEQPDGGSYDAVTDEEIAAAPAASVVFDGLAPALKRVEVWLPLRSRVRVTRVRVDDGAVCEPPDDDRPRWVVHGSSITHCAEAHSPYRSWPAVAAARAGVHLTNLGLGGNCLLDQWAARALRDLRADAITLKLGINVWNLGAMTERVFAAAVHGFIDTIRDGHRTTPILVVSPIYCAGGEEAPGPSVVDAAGRYVAAPGERPPGALSIGRMRELLEAAVEVRRRLGDEALTYLDGRELLGPADAGFIPDGLHPSAEGYVLMGERFAERGLVATG